MKAAAGEARVHKPPTMRLAARSPTPSSHHAEKVANRKEGKQKIPHLRRGIQNSRFKVQKTNPDWRAKKNSMGLNETAMSRGKKILMGEGDIQRCGD